MTDRLSQLEQKVQYLEDRLAIQDLVMRHCRGVDRHDVDLMNSCYHPEAEVKHGNSSTLVSGATYGEWSNGAHTGRFGLHSHNITNMNVEIDGDVAYSESYHMCVYMSPDQKRTSVEAGRYVDQLERRDGEWKILRRRGFIDIVVEGDASYLGNFRGEPIDHKQFWSTQDPSYERPIDLTTPSPQWT